MIHFQAKVLSLQILFRISSFKLNHLHLVSKTSQPKLETKFSLRIEKQILHFQNDELGVGRSQVPDDQHGLRAAVRDLPQHRHPRLHLPLPQHLPDGQKKTREENPREET